MNDFIFTPQAWVLALQLQFHTAFILAQVLAHLSLRTAWMTCMAVVTSLPPREVAKEWDAFFKNMIGKCLGRDKTGVISESVTIEVLLCH